MTEPGKITELDDLFALAQRVDPQPTDRLLARILADAVQVAGDRHAVASIRSVPVRSRGRLGRWIRTIGGWPAMGGLAMAAATGVYVGVAPPDSLAAIGQAVWGETVTVSLDDPLGLSGLSGLEG